MLIMVQCAMIICNSLLVIISVIFQHTDDFMFGTTSIHSAPSLSLMEAGIEYYCFFIWHVYFSILGSNFFSFFKRLHFYNILCIEFRHFIPKFNINKLSLLAAGWI